MQSFVGSCWPIVHWASIVAEGIVLLTVMGVRWINTDPFSLSFEWYGQLCIDESLQSTRLQESNDMSNENNDGY